MPLSEHEQRLLEQMEQALYAEDPKFATSLRSGSGGRASRTRAAIGVLVLLAGIGVLLVGAILPLVPVGVAGFAIMIVGTAVAYSGLRPGARGGEATAEGDTPAGPARPKRSAARQGGGFMGRLEDRWQKRRDQGPGAS